jgi:hypothetical protein
MKNFIKLLHFNNFHVASCAIQFRVGKIPIPYCELILKEYDFDFCFENKLQFQCQYQLNSEIRIMQIRFNFCIPKNQG